MAPGDSIDPSRDYSLPGWGTGPEGVVVYIRIRNTQLNVSINIEDFHRSPKSLEKLFSNKAKFLSDDREDTADSFEYCEEVAALFLPTLRLLAPQVDHNAQLTLADLSLRFAYEAHIEFYDEQPNPSRVTEVDPEEQDGCDSDHCEITHKTWPFPRFRSSDVRVHVDGDPAFIFDVPAEKVSVNGQQLFWKPAWIAEESIVSIEKYCRILRSNLSPHELPTSRLYGIVVNGKGALQGQLYHWIDIQHHLTWEVLENTPYETRAKWASQVRATVSSLHAIDVVWGDVKAQNVVVDTDGNAIVIDLEGGGTKGWVDRDIIGTTEGDLQGLGKLQDYILNESSPLRIRDKDLDLHWSDDLCSEESSSQR